MARRQRRAAQELGATSHSRTVRSSLAEASILPSGLNATPKTQLEWPFSGSPSGLAESHVPQLLPENALNLHPHDSGQLLSKRWKNATNTSRPSPVSP